MQENKKITTKKINFYAKNPFISLALAIGFALIFFINPFQYLLFFFAILVGVISVMTIQGGNENKDKKATIIGVFALLIVIATPLAIILSGVILQPPAEPITSAEEQLLPTEAFYKNLGAGFEDFELQTKSYNISGFRNISQKLYFDKEKRNYSHFFHIVFFNDKEKAKQETLNRNECLGTNYEKMQIKEGNFTGAFCITGGTYKHYIVNGYTSDGKYVRLEFERITEEEINEGNLHLENLGEEFVKFLKSNYS